MANPEHLKILKQGVEHWNKWRKESYGVHPNLEGADLSHMDLCSANLNWTNLSGANLKESDLINADLNRSNLSQANLIETGLFQTSFIQSDLSNTNLAEANLNYANFTEANLTNAELTGANLCGANFTGANLKNTNLENSLISHTVFSNVDLSKTKGLNNLNSRGPSTIDHWTLIISRSLPEKFLRDSGFPDQFIEYLPSLIGSLEPIQFHSCFISHSSKDKEFADRLYTDLQTKGIRCWYSPQDLKIGDEMAPIIDNAIRLHDKLLLVFSENSIASAWVRKEAREALSKKNDTGKKDVLFPIRLDDSIMETTEQWADDVKRERHIGDFRNWKDHDAYQKSFERLLRDMGKE